MDREFITGIKIGHTQHRLKKPYELSFGTVTDLDSVTSEISFNSGRVTLAETVPLPGYSNETKESILSFLELKVKRLTGESADAAAEIIREDLLKAPFACSPLLTAIDLLSYKITLSEKTDFVIPASSTHLNELKEIMRSNPAKTIKIKLSGNVQLDTECINMLEKTGTNNQIRFDVNKGFSHADAVAFYSALRKSPVLGFTQYIEQPLGENCWDEHRDLVEKFPEINTLLDESIVDTSHLKKAISIGIRFVKFKLFKQGGITELVNLIKEARASGLNIVLGNGVATSLSNKIENSIYHQYKDFMFGASEANGFLKLQ